MTANAARRVGPGLTTHDVARRLGLSPRTVIELAQRGELAHHRFEGARAKYRFSADQVDAYEAARQGRLTVEETAELLGVSVSAVRRMCREGTLAHTTEGRAYRFDRAVVQALAPLRNQAAAAQYLGVGRRMMQALIETGAVRPVLVGRRRFFAQDALERYVESTRRGPVSPA